MKILYSTALLFFAYGAMAQEQAQPGFAPAELKLTTKLSQYVFRNINLTAEKAINARQTIGVTLEYRPGGKTTGMADAAFGPLGTSYYQPHLNSLYNGATIGVNSKFYFIKDKSLYVDAVGFYRRWWFDEKYVDHRDVEAKLDIAATRNERLDVYGFKALFGRSFVRRTKSMTYVLDIYAGVGVRNKQRTSESYNGRVNDVYYSYKIERAAGWMPTLQGGLQLGIGR